LWRLMKLFLIIFDLFKLLFVFFVLAISHQLSAVSIVL